MTSLVLELQRDAFEPSVSVLTLLRKALVVSKKLAINEFEKWIELELNGYDNGENLPVYRLVTGELKARNPYRGWIPIIMYEPETAEFLSTAYIRDPVSKLEEMEKDKSNRLIMHFSKELELYLIKNSTSDFIPALHICRTSLTRILEAIRDIILRWSLKLEEDGILGEGMTFSPKEKQIAQAAHYTIGAVYMSNDHSTNIQAGRDVSNNLLDSQMTGVIASGNISGTVNNAIHQLQSSNSTEALQLAELLKKLQALIEAEPSLSQDDKEIALQQVAVLADEGQNPKKDSAFKPVKTAIAALKGVTSALAPTTELVKEFNQLLPLITHLIGL